MTKCSGSIWCLVALCLLGTTAMASVETQFFDGNGVLLTGVNVDLTLYDQFGNVQSRTTLPAEPDGTYDVPVAVGDKVGFQVYNGERTLGGMSEIQLKVPATQGPLPITVLGGPANDDCVNAQAIGSLPASVGGTTTGAAGPDAEAGAACGTSVDAGTPGVWYTVVGTGTSLTASTCNTAAYDTKISVYCQDCDTPPLCVAGNDDGAGCAGFTSQISWCSQPGITYRIYIHGFFGEFGAFTLNVTDSGATCTPSVNCIPPPPTGACCNCLPNAPFNCSVGTPDECTALYAGEYQGDDSECVVVSGAASVYNDTAAPAPIPDNNPAGVTISVPVPDSFFVADLNVGIGITHTWIGDLLLRVKHVPSGVEQELWTAQCGSTDNITSTADDEGTNLTCAGIASGGIDVIFWPPAVGGQGPLNVFDGLNAQGQWDFLAIDTFAADVGSVNTVRLTFLGGQPLCTGGGGDDDDDAVACEDCQPEADGKVTICHIPPGNPGNAHTIRVSPSALPAHCGNHGDTCGECGSEALVHDTIIFTTDRKSVV